MKRQKSEESVEGSGNVLSVTAAAATVIRDNDLHSLELAAVESLSDLVADNVFLPTLFATFDCGTFAIDLLQPFVQLLARCTSVIVTAGLEQLGPAKEKLAVVPGHMAYGIWCLGLEPP
eukprot:scaffold4260_cov178-Ochromonas_danica.AAC.2